MKCKYFKTKNLVKLEQRKSMAKFGLLEEILQKHWDMAVEMTKARL